MQKKKSKKIYLILLIILILLLAYSVISPGLQITLLSLLDTLSGKAPQPASPPVALDFAPTSGTLNNKIDPNLIASWDTGCLVPDEGSDWAERHTFSFNSNGTANHKRYSGGRLCNNLTVDHNDNFTWEIVGNGQINLYYSTGGKIYDIYQISGDTLKFGHGFCNCTSSGGKYGGSDGDRFVQLNNFLLYKKQ